MALKFLISLVFIFLSVFAQGQELKVPIKIIVSEFNNKSKKLANVDIGVLLEKDTIARLRTNLKGVCDTVLRLKYGQTYTFKLNKDNYTSYHSTSVTIDTCMSYVIETNLYRYYRSRPCTPTYNYNELEMAPETCDSTFPQVFIELETKNYCLEFTYYTAKNESRRIARKRIENFKAFMSSGGVGSEKYVVQMMAMICIENDCRARIEGRVLGMDSDCDNTKN
jgi:hypothetical protein